MLYTSYSSRVHLTYTLKCPAGFTRQWMEYSFLPESLHINPSLEAHSTAGTRLSIEGGCERMINQSTIQQVQQMAFQVAQAQARQAQQLSALAQEGSRTSSQLQQMMSQLSQLNQMGPSSWQSVPSPSSYSGYGGYGSSPQYGQTFSTSGYGSGYGQPGASGSFMPGSSASVSPGFFPQAEQYLRSQDAGSMQP